jgi:hypothetical protein
MLLKISDSSLNEQDAKKLGFKVVNAEEAKALGVPAYAGFVLPYFDLKGKPTKFWRIRYLEDTRKGFEKVTGQKTLRYMQPSGTTNEVYLPPFVKWADIASNATHPIVITEGELKAAIATKLGMPTIGLGGVFCFRSSRNNQTLLPMLMEFDWEERKVIICYDSDAATNPNVTAAENMLAAELTQHGAQVFVARLNPAPDGSKMGIDDFLLSDSIDDLKLIIDAASNFSESAALHALSEQVCYVRDPGIIYDHKNQMRLSTDAFTRHAYANTWHNVIAPTGKSARVQTATAWLTWPFRSELDSITFAPGEPKITNRRLNMWDGWPVEPIRGDVKPWKELLDHLFEGTEPGARKWFEQWCAYPLQNPGKKMANAVVFWGIVQGSGKTLAGHTLMKLYGEYATEIKDNDLESARFEWAENKQFVLADDITGQDNRKLKRRLMTMITQKLIRLDPKYIPSYTVEDCINYYFTSNDPDAFYMDDGDRRFFIHEVKADKIGVSLRKRYIEWRDSTEGIQALFHYLLGLDLSDFDPQAEAYATLAKAEMTSITKSDLASWVADLRINPVRRLKLPGDLFTASELLLMYDPMHTTRVTVNGMARELARASYRAPGKTGNMSVTKYGNVRLYAVKNERFWSTQRAKIIVEHYEANRTMEPLKKSGKPKF